ncbi:MAG: hypothetical protein ACI3XT_03965 [Butyricicoccaceae bacterium]
MNRNNQKENAAYGQNSQSGEQNNGKSKNGKNKKNASDASQPE